MTTKNYNLKRLNEISKFDEIELLIVEKKFQNLFENFDPLLLNEIQWVKNFMTKAKGFISNLGSGAKAAYDYVKKKATSLIDWLKTKLEIIPRIKIEEIREAIGIEIENKYVKGISPNLEALHTKLLNIAAKFAKLITEEEVKREMAIVSKKTGDVTDSEKEIKDVVSNLVHRKINAYFLRSSKVIVGYHLFLLKQIDEGNMFADEDAIKNLKEFNFFDQIYNVELIKSIKNLQQLKNIIPVKISQDSSSEDKLKTENIKNFIILEELFINNNDISILSEGFFDGLKAAGSALLGKDSNSTIQEVEEKKSGVGGLAASLMGLADDDGNWNKWLILALIAAATGGLGGIAATTIAALGIGLKTVGQMSKSYVCNKVADEAVQKLESGEIDSNGLRPYLNKAANCNYRITTGFDPKPTEQEEASVARSRTGDEDERTSTTDSGTGTGGPTTSPQPTTTPAGVPPITSGYTPTP